MKRAENQTRLERRALDAERAGDDAGCTTWGLEEEKEELRETRFERQKKKAISWYWNASDLRGSAGAIWASMHETEFASIPKRLGLGADFSFSIACPAVYLMLWGMAIKLILKAIIVKKGGEPKHQHNLLDHWKEAGLESTETQHGLLSILTEAITWAGRYPVPKEEAKFDQFTELTWKHLFTPLGEESDFREPNGALSWESFNQLWAQVCLYEPLI